MKHFAQCSAEFLGLGLITLEPDLGLVVVGGTALWRLHIRIALGTAVRRRLFPSEAEKLSELVANLEGG